MCPGNVIVRQRGTVFYPGANVCINDIVLLHFVYIVATVAISMVAWVKGARHAIVLYILWLLCRLS